MTRPNRDLTSLYAAISNDNGTGGYTTDYFNTIAAGHHLTGQAQIRNNLPDLASFIGNIPDWVAQAECSQTDPEAFFPEKGGSNQAAKQLCSTCPFKQRCLDWALTQPPKQDYGIWGGTSEQERRAMRRELRRQESAA